MVTNIVIGWLIMGFIIWASATMHDVLKRQDKILKWINESIVSRDLPRKESPLLKEMNYPFIAIVKGLVLTLIAWPVVINRKLGGW